MRRLREQPGERRPVDVGSEPGSGRSKQGNPIYAIRYGLPAAIALAGVVVIAGERW